MEDEYVYVVNERVKLSCDSDYEFDGFMINWDCDELGTNLKTTELIEEIKKIDDELYKKVNEFIDGNLSPSLRVFDSYLDDNYFDEVFEFLQEEIGGDVFYKYNFQYVSKIKEIHKTEESAKKAVDYYTKSRSYNNEFSYTRHKIDKWRY